jgi:glycosyltransferase involved in cell wall biosynthesis
MRRIRDIVISSVKCCWYYITESPRLWYNRYLHRNEYDEKNPLISIYCPTYNRANLLIERAVKSVLAQSYKNFEFIIIGDHCTDDTEKLISQIKDPRVKFYNLPYRKKRYPPTAENHWFAGPVVPSNEALKRVTGTWIARIDDDDIWPKNHIEVLLREAQKRNLEFISADVETIQYGKKVIYKAKDQPIPVGGTQTWLYKSYLKFFKYNIDCWRKSWNKVNDYDILTRMYQAGVKMGYINKILAYVYPRPNEETIGSKAYGANVKDVEEHFKFEE